MRQNDPVAPRGDFRQYRTVEFTDGLLIFDREDTAGWIHSDFAVGLRDIR